jgi:uncharacterized protein
MHWLLAVLGGMMIGAASGFLLLTHGRIAGISGVVDGLLQRGSGDRGWRAAFVGGLIAAGMIASLVAPSAIGAQVRSLPMLAVAGVLVGYGTQLGRGCTSGHGVCGISRLSKRSFVAVATFMISGAITATLVGAVS